MNNDSCDNCEWSFIYVIQQGSSILCESLRCMPFNHVSASQKATGLCNCYRRKDEDINM